MYSTFKLGVQRFIIISLLHMYTLFIFLLFSKYVHVVTSTDSGAILTKEYFLQQSKSNYHQSNIIPLFLFLILCLFSFY